MSFSWKDCEVINSRYKNIVADCFKGIGTYSYCLTPNVVKGLKIWLSNKIHKYSAGRFDRKGVEDDIAELLRECCEVDRVALLMKRDVSSAEMYIIPHIKNAIKTGMVRGIYSENLPEETYEDYRNRKIITQKDLEEYMKGIVEL